MASDSPQFRRHMLRSAPRVKSACPYCFREVYENELRAHWNVCEGYARREEEGEDSYAGRESSSSNSSFLLEPDLSSSDEEHKVPNSNLMARLFRLNQSSDLEPVAPRFSYSPEPQVYPMRPKTAKGNSTVCPVCNSDYSRKPKTPLVLPACGHTICAECAKQLFNDTQSLRCPICRSRSHQAPSGLPVNFALLEITETAGKKETCPKHNVEIVAFCKEDEVLLCGICLFEHKGHTSFLLNSPEAEEIASTNRAELDGYEAALEQVKSLWQATVADVNELSRCLNSSVERHNLELRQSEMKLLKQVQAGKSACVKRLKTLEADCKVQGLRKSCEEAVQRIGKNLRKLKDSKARFDVLPVAEQLATARSFKADTYTQPPPLDTLISLEQRLNQEVDYDQAIRSGVFLP